MSNVFEKIAEWFVTEGEVVITDVETVLGAVAAKAKIVIGYAEAIDMTVVSAANPALAVGIMAGLEGLKNLLTDVSGAVTAVGNTAPQIAAELHALSTAADTFHLQASPFYTVLGNDISTVSTAAVASVAAIAGTKSATA